MALPNVVVVKVAPSGSTFQVKVVTSGSTFQTNISETAFFSRLASESLSSRRATSASYALVAETALAAVGTITSASLAYRAELVSASGVIPGTYPSGSYTIQGNLTVSGTIYASTASIVVGDDPGGNDAVRISGSLRAIGAVSASALHITSENTSVYATSSWAENSVTSSFSFSSSVAYFAQFVSASSIAGLVSSASYAAVAGLVNWNNISGIPVGLISSSTQINNLGVSASWASRSVSASYAGTDWSNIANKPSGLVSSSVQAAGWTVASSSVSITASYALNAGSGITTWDELQNKPDGIVSSSVQVTNLNASASWASSSISASFARNSSTASLAINIQGGVESASYATQALTASYAVTAGSVAGIYETASFAITASYAARALSSSFAPTTWDSVANRPTGLVSSSTQVTNLNASASWASQSISASYAGTDWNSVANKPAGLVSSSTQINNLGVSASWASRSVSSSYAGTDWNAINNRPSNLVSSSIQVTNLNASASWASQSVSSSFARTSATASYITGTITVDFDGAVTASHFLGTGSSPQFIGTSSVAQSAISSSYARSASYAGTDWNAINNRPTGLISSSVQLPTGLVSSSVQVTNLNASASWASSSISSSYAQNAANSIQSQTASLAINVQGGVESASYAAQALTSSYAVTAGSVVGIYETASFAVTASYAQNARSSSYAFTNWESISNIPSGLVSSSTQITNLNASASWASQSVSASYAGTDWNAVANKPVGLVSSSIQAETWTVASASVATSSSYALSASWAPGGENSATASYVSGGVVIIGLPTDGAYGGSAGNVSGISEGDEIEDAFDKVETILGLLAPAKPANLSTRTLTIQSTYSALEAGTGASRSTITTSTQPSASWTFAAATSGSGTTLSYNADDGVLSAEIDGGIGAASFRSMSTVNDVGTYENLMIVADLDPYAGTFGQQGFWKGFIARTAPTSSLSLGAHTTRLIHSQTGATPLYTFYIDNPRTPTVVSMSLSSSAYTGRYISGVPSVRTGDTFTLYFTASNAVSQFYNNTRINAGSSTIASAVNQSLPTTPPVSGAFVSASITLSVSNSTYQETASFTGTAYNSQGTTGTSTITSSLGSSNFIRCDTVSNENRVYSGIGQYPLIGTNVSESGGPFPASQSLLNNRELQMINGIYQYPPARNYSFNYPVPGPNYTSILPDTFEAHRWYTFTQSVASVSAVTVTFNGASFPGTTIATSGSMRVYIRVSGSSPTNGWIDGATAYPGTGDPTNNGDPALVIGSSTNTAKRITFGTSVKTGVLFVRVGIPSGSSRTFTSITVT